MNQTTNTSTGRKRTRIVRPYPTHTLEDALDIASTIQEANAGLPFDRKLLARAVGTTPASSGYTMRLNSAAKYGLTQGAYNDDQISLTKRGEAIVAPKDNDERRDALIEAATEPEIFGRFYQLLDGKRLPEDTYAQNMLQREFGVNSELTSECLGIIKANGTYLGILQSDSGATYIRLRNQSEPTPIVNAKANEMREPYIRDSETKAAYIVQSEMQAQAAGRIFIGYGRNNEAVEFIKNTLDAFGIAYGVAETDAPGSQPVPAAVSSEMRKCTSAILIIDDSQSSSRMLYQIGAASVLYAERVIIFRNSEVEMGNELSGIRSVEYAADDAERAGLELMKALAATGVVKITA